MLSIHNVYQPAAIRDQLPKRLRKEKHRFRILLSDAFVELTNADEENVTGEPRALAGEPFSSNNAARSSADGLSKIETPVNALALATVEPFFALGRIGFEADWSERGL